MGFTLNAALLTISHSYTSFTLLSIILFVVSIALSLLCDFTSSPPICLVHCFILLAAQAIHRINVALANGEDSTATLEAIKSSVLALRSITDECSDTYRTKLMEAQRKKAESAG